MDTNLSLNVYGVGVHVHGPAEVIRRLHRDFHRFEAASSPDIRVRAWLAAPPRVRVPRCHVARRSGVVWDEGTVRWVVWTAGPAVRWDYDREQGEAWAERPEALHEALYLLILSRVGEHHDWHGIHRLHTMGLNAHGRAVLVVLPSGTGKSTLAFSALAAGLGPLLSDDMVLIDGDRVLPFPTRLGSVAPPTGVAPQFVEPFPRMRHGLKYVVDVEAFGDRVGGPSVGFGSLIVGHRGAGGRSQMVEVPSAVVAPELARSMVTGIGLPQVLEFFVRADAADLRLKLRTLRSRTLAAYRLATGSRTFYWRLGDDQTANLRALEGRCADLG